MTQIGSVKFTGDNAGEVELFAPWLYQSWVPSKHRIDLTNGGVLFEGDSLSIHINASDPAATIPRGAETAPRDAAQAEEDH